MIRPSESELSILKIFWKNGPSSVKEIHEILSKDKTTGYTTTLKLMQIMLEKGLLSRTSEGATGRSHIYEARVSEIETSGQLLDSFLNRVFEGSAGKLVLRALGKGKPSDQEIQQIRALLDELEQNKPDE